VQENIIITDAATSKIAKLLNENHDALGLRVYVQGGGCGGFQYGFAFEENIEEDDFTIDHKGIMIVVDAMSRQYLEGATIDYVEELMGAHFEIKNPNAKTTCGCGSSFSV
jgi:iron-sulfur cluster insertion protein